MTMETEHFNAMQAYAEQHGRKWVARLTQAWLNDWPEQWGLLRQVRNHPDYHACKGFFGIFETYDRERKRRLEIKP